MLTLADPPPLRPATGGDVVPVAGGYRTLAAGEFLFRQGDARSHVYRVEKGSVCLFKQRADGSSDVIEFAFPGDLVGLGQLDSHVCAAQATIETQLSCLPRSFAEAALERRPGWVARLTAAIEREVVFLKEAQLARTTQPRPLERIAALLVTLARGNAYEGRDPSVITDALSCGVVAGYLNMSVDELARWLGELNARGLVEVCAQGLRLKDFDELERLAEVAS
jgi:CRP/FNR family transcriptional regulator, anaerobic regulatory protein